MMREQDDETLNGEHQVPLLLNSTRDSKNGRGRKGKGNDDERAR
jgi:hypothetical protein